MASYVDALEIAVQTEMDVLGEEAALAVVRDVPDLTVSDDGAVEELRGDGKDVLAELVRAYQDVGGDVTAALIARRIRRAEITDIDLPEVLEARM